MPEAVIYCPLCELEQKHQVSRKTDNGCVTFQAICDNCGHLLRRKGRLIPTIKFNLAKEK
jgi:uncharacterized Zn finger protein